jgi:hypothetical protein
VNPLLLARVHGALGNHIDDEVPNKVILWFPALLSMVARLLSYFFVNGVPKGMASIAAFELYSLATYSIVFLVKTNNFLLYLFHLYIVGLNSLVPIPQRMPDARE